MSDFGLMYYFLGIDITQFEDEIFIAQKNYTTSHLEVQDERLQKYSNTRE